MEIERHPVGNVQLAVRKSGAGSPLLFVHGWPLSGLTWRKITPLLSTHTCYAVDLCGAGETTGGEDVDFTFTGQANNLAPLVETIAALHDVARVDVVAHDTGASIARKLALTSSKIGKLVLIDTEIPGHRPPWIPLYQTLVRAPGSATFFQVLLRSKAFRRSSLGYGGCFVDKSLLDGEFDALFIAPLIGDAAKMRGQIRYLRGIEWSVVDAFATDHARITSDVLLLWGKDDEIFPLARAEPMTSQFKNAKLVVVDGARLLPHEEKPEVVARHIAAFLA
jgi:pimeloyl-ACP methyl ester carboxylesterase